MQRIQFLASHTHYADHLRPIYEVLPAAVRGGFHERAADLAPGMLTVVASYGDYLKTTDQPVVFLEHGAGFRYNVKHPSYAGGPGRDRVVLFCNVNELVAAQNEAVYPHVRSEIVGCPKLDVLASTPAPSNETPTVAFSWHWQCRVAPETKSAWRHYEKHLRRIAQDNSKLWTPLGHSHPLAWSMVRFHYARWQWDTTRRFEEVVRRADVYVCDSSSTIYEFAALDRPVVVMNAPWYRKNVHHGLRFWDHIPGIQVDGPDQLADAIHQALTNDTWGPERRRIAQLVYPHLGSASKRAADAILQLL